MHDSELLESGLDALADEMAAEPQLQGHVQVPVVAARDCHGGASHLSHIDDDAARVGKLEIDGKAPAVVSEDLMLGGRSDNDSNWEGRLDEAAVFNRALTADEVAKLAVP